MVIVCMVVMMVSTIILWLGSFALIWDQWDNCALHDSRQQDDNDDDDYNNDICDDDDDDYNDVGDDDDNDDDENYNVLTQFSIAQSFDFHRLPFSAIAENSVRKYLKHQSKVKIKY